MIFEPHHGYRDYRLPLFIIHANDRFVTIRSELGDMKVKRLDELVTTHRVIYSCISLDTLCLYGDPARWTIRTWNNRVSAAWYGDVKLYPLCDAWTDDVTLFFDFIESRNVAASSLNTMSLNLWRTTLDVAESFREEAPLDVMMGPVAIHTGGRKEARRGTYRNRVEYDMVAAYPNALAQGIPSRLSVTSESFARNLSLDAEYDGLAIARVRIPPHTWGPIPVIIDMKAELSCYGYTAPNEWATVALPLSELRMAADYGCDVDIIAFHHGISRRTTFGRWMVEIVYPLRALPGMAGTLGKLVANRLWSCFAVSPIGVRCEHTFTHDGTMCTRELPPDSTKQILRRAATTYVGALVQSRVRQRLYREGLTNFSGVVYVDTDGLIAKRSDNVPAGWRQKATMRYVDVAGPQAIQYYCDQCLPPPLGHDGPHWTVAGATSNEAKSRLFKVMKSHDLMMTNINNVLPPQDVNNVQTDSTKTYTPTFNLEGAPT